MQKTVSSETAFLMPIMIASKGRAGKSSTIETLTKEKVPFKLFIEPQECADYAQTYPQADIYPLAKKDQGISYVRNIILEYCRLSNWEWFWMLDDDILGMFTVKDSKCVRAPWAEVLDSAFKSLSQFHDLGIGALEYNQYAWAAKNQFAMNSYCDVAVLINATRTKPLKYRDNCKEDRDFALQTLQMGLRTARTSTLAFACPKNGSNPGGLQDAYKSGLEIKWSQRMVELWPGICEHQIKKDGRQDVKIHWRRMRKA